MPSDGDPTARHSAIWDESIWRIGAIGMRHGMSPLRTVEWHRHSVCAMVWADAALYVAASRGMRRVRLQRIAEQELMANNSGYFLCLLFSYMFSNAK